MKILIAGHFECDYLAATVNVGLYESEHEIYELPYCRHYHGDVDQGYTLWDGKSGFTAPPGYMTNPLPDNEHSEEEILDLAPTFDLFVMHSTRPYAVAAIDKISQRLGKVPSNLVICDGEDSEWINVPLVEKYRPLVFFKRELVRGKLPIGYVPRLQCNLIPLPFGAFPRSYPDNIDDTNKIYDIFVSLGNTHESRLPLLRTCIDYGRTHGLCYYVGSDPNSPLRNEPEYAPYLEGMQGWLTYMRMQAQSKIAVVRRGHGRDTLHAWEAFSFATAVCYEDPGVYIPYPFENEKHCLYYFREDCVDLEFLFDRLLQDPELAQSLAAAGKAHCRQYHTAQARAEYLLEITRRVMEYEELRLDEFGLYQTMQGTDR